MNDPKLRGIKIMKRPNRVLNCRQYSLFLFLSNGKFQIILWENFDNDVSIITLTSYKIQRKPFSICYKSPM